MKRSVSLFLVIIILVMFALSYSQPLQSGVIAGSISDMRDTSFYNYRGAVQGALVEVIGQALSCSTDCLGEFAIGGLAPGYYDISITDSNRRDTTLAQVLVQMDSVTWLSVALDVDYPFPNYRWGDCNSDGWCNFSDGSALFGYYGGGQLPCWPAADINDSGYLNTYDLELLLYWLMNWEPFYQTPPCNLCPTPVSLPSFEGKIKFDSCLGAPGQTIYLNCYAECDTMGTLQLILAYDNREIDSFFVASVNPIFEWQWYWGAYCRELMPPGNQDTLSTASIYLCNLHALPQFLPSLTYVFQIGVVISEDATHNYHPLVPTIDRYWGPSRLFDACGYRWADPEIQIGPAPCSYFPGDINGNGSVNGIDIVYAVNYLKTNNNPPPIDCFPSCPLTPNPFYAAGDVNGNCAFNGIDITFFVRYLKLQVPSLLYCQDCPPGRM